uniref:Uncharacterized protein n=1 Tax=Rhipicephalus microplus TaxID=6941 RepID=A0A6G5AFY2_RHIMP
MMHARPPSSYSIYRAFRALRPRCLLLTSYCHSLQFYNILSQQASKTIVVKCHTVSQALFHQLNQYEILHPKHEKPCCRFTKQMCQLDKMNENKGHMEKLCYQNTAFPFRDHAL